MACFGTMKGCNTSKNEAGKMTNFRPHFHPLKFHCMKYFLFILFSLTFGPAFSQQKQDTSSSAMVASAHPMATEAGLLMLKQGGNAFDAIAASAFMLSVVEPSMSGLGGRLQAIYFVPGQGVKGLDATTQVPASYVKKAKEAEHGFGTIGVPGMVKGIVQLQQQNGKLPLKQVMAPAIAAASKGHALLSEESRRESIEIKELRKFEGTTRHFLQKDTVYPGGSLFKQPALAKTLKTISRDKGKAFYTGGIAYALTEEIKKGGGFLSMVDMKNYRAEEAKIVRGNYRGYEIIGTGLPCYGAIVIEMLQMLEQVDLSNRSEKDFLQYHAASHYKAYEDRPLLKTKEDSLVLSSYAAKRWKDSLPSTIAMPGNTIVADHNNGHTTHLVASDKEGNMVSVTQSVGPLMGSKVASVKNGFVLATTMGPYLGQMKPGERASSHISPIIILKDGKPFLALGAAGGARIVPAIVQVISRVIDQGMSLEQALSAGRVYQMPDKLLVENHKGVYWKDGKTMDKLRESGIKLEEVKSPAIFGRVHAIQYQLPGIWIGAADPDWSGTAKGLKN